MLKLLRISLKDILKIDVTCLRESKILSKILFLSSVTWLILLALCAGPALATGGSRAESFYSRGEALVKQGKVDAAIKEFYRALQLNPENTGMRTRLAWLLLDQNQPDSALQHFERLLSQRPQDKTAISGLAICFLKMGRPERAVVVLNRGLQFLPRDTLLLKLKGEALSSRRETAGEAVKVYDEVLKIQPGKAEWAKARQTAALLAASHSYFEAQAYLKKGDRAAALQAFKRALEFEPKAIGYRTHYSWVLRKTGR
jgi:tetratricopeptide (TPR) repeat protein